MLDDYLSPLESMPRQVLLESTRGVLSLGNLRFAPPRNTPNSFELPAVASPNRIALASDPDRNVARKEVVPALSSNTTASVACHL